MAGTAPDAHGGREPGPGPDGEADPLLVRPYILGTPDDLDRGRPAETWPEPGPGVEPATAAGPDPVPEGGSTPVTHAGRHAAAGDGPDAAAGAGVVRAVALVRSAPNRRRRGLLLVGAAAVTGTLAVAGAFAALRQDDGGTATTAEPPAVVPTATAPSGEGASGTEPVSRAPSGRGTPPRKASAPATRAPASSRAARPATTPTAAAPPGASAASIPPATNTRQPLVPPAAPERAGTITGPGGRCLDVDGDGQARGHRLQVADCDGSATQTWTLPADGTLRTGGRCGQAGNGGSVKLVDCDSQAVGRWRRDKDRSLLNIGTGNCLTDPDNGSRNGAPVVVRACDGGPAQQWSLP